MARAPNQTLITRYRQESTSYS